MQYDATFVTHRPILSENEKVQLRQMSQRYPLAKFLGDARNFEEMAVDFVYTSAKIEGNTYDRIDTDNLLRLGVTAGGKRYSDAVMLVNLRDGFGMVMGAEAQTDLNTEYLCDLHKVLMKDLLPTHEQGIVRTTAVHIGASSYTPPTSPARLRTELQFILPESRKYEDPFEQAIYLHCNLAYLQYFRDGNKRTSRLMQTAALVRGGVLPLFFNDTLIDKYQRATVQYYETGDYSAYVDFFKANYELTINSMMGPTLEHIHFSEDEAADFQDRIAQLPNLEHRAGAAHTFWMIAKDELSQRAPESVNWADIERRTIVESLSLHEQQPDDVIAALQQHSPGAVTQQQKQSIKDDVATLCASLQRKQRSTDELRVSGGNPRTLI